MKRFTFCLIITGMVLALIAAPVLAAMPTSLLVPDSASPAIVSVDMYENYLQLNDVLAVVNYNMKYTSANLPTQTINTTFVGNMLSGSSQIGSIAPYPYYSNGYAPGIFSLYWAAGSAGIPSWSGAYTAQIAGNPGISWLGTSATSSVLYAVAYNATGPVWTTQTTAANNATANDMSLSYAVAQSAYYFAGTNPFSKVTINIGTSGVGTYTIVWEYYNSGGSWTALPGIVDGTTGFTAAAGNHDVTWTVPTDWATTNVNSVGVGYYIRARVSAYSSMGTLPLGTQAWINSGSNPPIGASISFTWHTTTTIAATAALLGSNVLSWANSFSNSWAIALTQQSASGQNQLSSYGEQYFNNAIPALQSAVSQIYPANNVIPAAVITTPAPTPIPAQLGNTWPVPSMTSLWKGAFFFVIVAYICGIIISMTRRVDLALFAAALSIPGGAYIGMAPMALAIIEAFLCVFVLGFTLILQRGAQ